MTRYSWPNVMTPTILETLRRAQGGEKLLQSRDRQKRALVSAWKRPRSEQENVKMHKDCWQGKWRQNGTWEIHLRKFKVNESR